jgi:hypothetical protein
MEVLQFCESLCTGLRPYRSCDEVTVYGLPWSATIPSVCTHVPPNLPKTFPRNWASQAIATELPTGK